jgi:hypothetical protein
MNNSYKNWFKGSLLFAVAAMGVASCADDHYDVVTVGEAEGKTLWQNIQENESLSEFASVLSATSFLKNDMDYPAASGAPKMTYAEYLNSPQSLTVWAPKNGTFNVEEKLAQLEEIKALYSTDRQAATKAEYNFATQFLGQHIARFNHETQGDDKRVRMLNAKYVVYDALAGTFDGVAFAEGIPSVPSSNGTLHVLSAPSIYAFNIFDYLSATPELSEVYAVFSSPEFDVTSFNPGWSTEGAMNNEGKMEYVDSVYSNTNYLLDRAGAKIKNEDSVYVAVVPTNAAYAEALEKVKSLYKFKDSYNYGWSGSDWGFKDKQAHKFVSDEEIDSLVTLNAKQLLLSSMFFTPSVMGETVNPADSASIIDYCLYNDSVNSTNWNTFYNKNVGGMNPLFLGLNEEFKEPVKASNGYIFAVDSYNVDLAYSFIKRKEANPSVLGSPLRGSNYSIGSFLKNDSIIDRFEIKSYTRVVATEPGNAMSFEVQLPALVSGSYKISALMVPTVYNMDDIELLDPVKQQPYVEQISFDVAVLDDNAKSLASIANVEAPSDRVEKVVLFEKFDLPYSYEGLPAGINSFPRLKFTLQGPQQKDRRTGAFKCLALNICKIVIEPYREDSTNE